MVGHERTTFARGLTFFSFRHDSVIRLVNPFSSTFRKKLASSFQGRIEDSNLALVLFVLFGSARLDHGCNGLIA
jgi:hypothetical protein